jgi:ABC-type transport system substrate-binding protein
MRWPKKSQWRNFLKILNLKEKIIFFFFAFLFFTSGIFLLRNFYLENTKIVPKKGGEYIEGMIGSPRSLNPIYALSSDVDRDLTELLFAGLMKYSQDGQIQPDLVKDYQILEEGKIYEFHLRDNLFWQDGKALTADDVIFTIETIQNPEIKSPLRTHWLGVEAEKISEKTFRFN